MNLNEYQALAQRTSGTLSDKDKLLNGVMGLNGEAGECIDVVKKHLFQGHELNAEKLIDELGEPSRKIAAKHGVSEQSVCDIKHGRIYAWMEVTA